MYSTNQFKKGLKILLDGTPFSVVEFQHVSPGKGSAFTRTKIRNLQNGNLVERTFKNNEKIEPANVETKDMKYLYSDSEGFHFMDIKSYEQIALQADFLGSDAEYLIEELEVQVMLWNERPIGIELPNFVNAVVKETEPAVRGDTVQGGTKPAKIAAGAQVMVPFHIKEGDKIRVDTRDGRYIEKIND